eukprot:TRINITY_DN75_c0_g1_i4.p1 TRINITY_DN75_c0_g1~~TRINITY_DN75_c0_g1_i4.p1  ORF type:complete len:149 (+),score=23.77 TRINITY_DN75_c0_g1_i4:60-506(+)
MSYLSGVLFAISWWVWIDANAYHNTIKDPIRISFGHWVPGIVATIALVMINAVSWTDLQGFGLGSIDDDVQKRARIWLFVSFTVGFGCLIASIWLGIDHWFIPENRDKNDRYTIWPGVALILQNAFILLSAVLYRFSKWPEADNYSTF